MFESVSDNSFDDEIIEVDYVIKNVKEYEVITLEETLVIDDSENIKKSNELREESDLNASLPSSSTCIGEKKASEEVDLGNSFEQLSDGEIESDTDNNLKEIDATIASTSKISSRLLGRNTVTEVDLRSEEKVKGEHKYKEPTIENVERDRKFNSPTCKTVSPDISRRSSKDRQRSSSRRRRERILRHARAHANRLSRSRSRSRHKRSPSRSRYGRSTRRSRSRLRSRSSSLRRRREKESYYKNRRSRSRSRRGRSSSRHRRRKEFQRARRSRSRARSASRRRRKESPLKCYRQSSSRTSKRRSPIGGKKDNSEERTDIRVRSSSSISLRGNKLRQKGKACPYKNKKKLSNI